MILYLRRLIFVLALSCYSLCAHEFPDSSFFFYAEEQAIKVKAKLPVDELYMDAGFDFEESVEEHGKLHRKEMTEYLLDKIHVTTLTGKPWQITFGNLTVENEGNFFQYIAEFTITPPEGESVRHFNFISRAIHETQVAHSSMVVLRSDTPAHMDENSPKMLGTLRFQKDSIEVNLGEIIVNKEGTEEEVHTPSGFKSALLMGIDHIASGTDHLLFLLTLLLPAPLLVLNNRWSKPSSVKASFFKLLKIVSAFTVGHSCTLIIAAFGVKFTSSKIVETCIALSIIVSAMHAIRPIFFNRETWIAGGFGIIHGAAFASSIVPLHMNLQGRLVALIGFNVGIEIMQMVVVVLTIPWLLILSRGSWYQWMKNIAAIMAIIASISWIIERMTDQKIGWQKPVEYLAQHAWYLLLGMACFSALSYSYQHFVRKN